MRILCFTIFGDESGAFWTMIGVLLLLISFLFVRRQLKIQNNSNMMNFIQSSENKWRSAEIIKQRKKVCSKEDNSIDYETECILSFFEDLGILYKRNVIDLELIWEKFSYYVENYWIILEPNIRELQEKTNDKTWFENFEYLHKYVIRFSKKKTGNKNYKIQEEDLLKFKQSEIK
jgi:hypothetical protein